MMNTDAVTPEPVKAYCIVDLQLGDGSPARIAVYDGQCVCQVPNKAGPKEVYMLVMKQVSDTDMDKTLKFMRAIGLTEEDMEDNMEGDAE